MLAEFTHHSSRRLRYRQHRGWVDAVIRISKDDGGRIFRAYQPAMCRVWQRESGTARRKSHLQIATYGQRCCQTSCEGRRRQLSRRDGLKSPIQSDEAGQVIPKRSGSKRGGRAEEQQARSRARAEPAGLLASEVTRESGYRRRVWKWWKTDDACVRACGRLSRLLG